MKPTDKKEIKPFIKWAGGKEKELSIIKENFPKTFTRYVEPFVGGGAVFLSLEKSNCIINDKSTELILLYKKIKESNVEFYKSLLNINKAFNNIGKFVNNNASTLLLCYKNPNSIEQELLDKEKELKKIIIDTVNINQEIFYFQLKRNLKSKIYRIEKIANESGKFSDEQILENIECSFKSAFYMYIRELYNKPYIYNNENLFCSFFYFIREYCYASMFRYNSQGEFNVPYGGISYNNKNFLQKIKYCSSEIVNEKLKNTKIYNLDFEEFLTKIKLKNTDFIFIDPPYDTKFSTYAKNVFGKNDQIRLSNYLKKTPSKFLLIIKKTDFILNLYKDFEIKSFEKKYIVSFKNRNNKDAEHLIITNYKTVQ